MSNKRKRDKSVDKMRRKIRRLEKKLEQRGRSKSSSSSSSDGTGHASTSEEEVQSGNSDSEYEAPVQSLTGAEVHDEEDAPPSPPPSPPPPAHAAEPTGKDTAAAEPVVAIAPDILDALGEAKTKEVLLGQNIPEEVSKRWGRILSDGLSKEHKQELINKTLIPENFQLLKAPLLNQEISAVLTDSSRNRDKRLEKAQNQLGVGIAGITTLMSSLIEGKVIETVDLVKRLSEIGQILLDLHYEHSLNRMKLITPILDKKFMTMIQDVKRDSHLFGQNLGGTIKATKTAEKSGLQIKKPAANTAASSSKKFTPQTSSWRGPPRQHAQRAARTSNNRSRGAAPAQKRAPPAAERAPPAPRTSRHTRR